MTKDSSYEISESLKMELGVTQKRSQINGLTEETK